MSGKQVVDRPVLLSKQSTAHLLGDVSVKTVDRLIKAGKIKVKKVGARVMPIADSVYDYARRSDAV
jgi:hypothetical protein